jgi:hypothetical protein
MQYLKFIFHYSFGVLQVITKLCRPYNKIIISFDIHKVDSLYVKDKK